MTKMKIIGAKARRPPPAGAVWVCSSEIIPGSYRQSAPSPLPPAPRRVRRAGRLRQGKGPFGSRSGGLRLLDPIPECQEVLAEHAAHDLRRVAAAQELLRQGRQLRHVHEPRRRVRDPVEVRAETDALSSGDLDDAVDVVDDAPPGSRRLAEGLHQLADFLLRLFRLPLEPLPNL